MSLSGCSVAVADMAGSWGYLYLCSEVMGSS